MFFRECDANYRSVERCRFWITERGAYLDLVLAFIDGTLSDQGLENLKALHLTRKGQEFFASLMDQKVHPILTAEPVSEAISTWNSESLCYETFCLNSEETRLLCPRTRSVYMKFSSLLRENNSYVRNGPVDNDHVYLDMLNVMSKFQAENNIEELGNDHIKLFPSIPSILEQNPSIGKGKLNLFFNN